MLLASCACTQLFQVDVRSPIAYYMLCLRSYLHSYPLRLPAAIFLALLPRIPPLGKNDVTSPGHAIFDLPGAWAAEERSAHVPFARGSDSAS
jgi:hypothetical protein